MTAGRLTTVTELIDAISNIRGFLELRESDAALSPKDRRDVERMLDRYQVANAAFGIELEELIRAATPRPRR